MTYLNDISTAGLRRIVAIKKQSEALQGQIDSIVDDGIQNPVAGEIPKNRRMSATSRARIAAAQRATWAKLKGKGVKVSKPTTKSDRRSSPAVRAKLAAAARARGAKAKSQRKKSV